MLKTQLIGHLGKDAEVRDAAGKKVISFAVAHTEKYTDRNGAKQEKTTWLNCSLWRQDGKTGIAQYLKKGTQVYVEGTPSMRTYENKEGQTVASLELTVQSIELLGGGKGTDKAGSTYDGGADDLPF